jgi:hypothetical protein
MRKSSRLMSRFKLAEIADRCFFRLLESVIE